MRAIIESITMIGLGLLVIFAGMHFRHGFGIGSEWAVATALVACGAVLWPVKKEATQKGRN